MENDNMGGYSSSLDEANSAEENYIQDLTKSTPSANLQRSVMTFDTSALVTPTSSAQLSMATAVPSIPAMAVPSSTLLSPPPQRREPISPPAGLFQTQQGHQITLNNPYQVSFPSQGVFDGERIINHGPPVPAEHHHQAINNNAQLLGSNLPSNIHMDSPSAATTAASAVHQLPIPQFLATMGNWNIGSSTQRPQWANNQLQNNQLGLVDPSALATTGDGNIGSSIQRPQWANSQLQNNQLPPVNPSAPISGQQEFGMQGVMGPDSPNRHQSVNSHPLQMTLGAPMGNPIPFQRPEGGMSSNYNSNQMRMNRIDNIPPTAPLEQVNRNPSGQNFLVPAPPNQRTPQNIGIYDPLYETIGLPVDPHLRAFLAEQHKAGKD